MTEDTGPSCTCVRNEVGWIVIPDRDCQAMAAIDPWRRDVPPEVDRHG